MRSKLATLLAVGALMLVLAAGAALAATFTCTQATCTGTDGNDFITGTARDQTIIGLRGNDRLRDRLGPDHDNLQGRKGDDFLNTQEGNNASSNTDRVNGGPGVDVCRVDSKDRVLNCEEVNPG
jgi:Ca2+-binding RTX toxin-like protein